MRFAPTAVFTVLALSTTALAGPTRHQRVQRRAAGTFTINIENRAGPGYYVSWANNPNSPNAINGVSNGALGSSAMGVYPTGWAGRIMIGKSDDPAVLNRGSMIVGSFINGFSSFDVSYIEGYSVPIVCSCQGTVVAGCNTALEHTGTECPEPGPADTCYNPLRSSAQAPGTQADPFFQPCQGNAMTYPQDFQPVTNPHCDDSAIYCCVGSSCPQNKYQPQKRSFDDEESTGSDYEAFDDFSAEEDPNLDTRDITDLGFQDAGVDTDDDDDSERNEEFEKRGVEEGDFDYYDYEAAEYDQKIEQRSFDDEHSTDIYYDESINDSSSDDTDMPLEEKRDLDSISIATYELDSDDGDDNDSYTGYDNAALDVEEIEARALEEEEGFNDSEAFDPEYDLELDSRSYDESDIYENYETNDPEYDLDLDTRAYDDDDDDDDFFRTYNPDTDPENDSDIYTRSYDDSEVYEDFETNDPEYDLDLDTRAYDDDDTFFKSYNPDADPENESDIYTRSPFDGEEESEEKEEIFTGSYDDDDETSAKNKRDGTANGIAIEPVDPPQAVDAPGLDSGDGHDNVDDSESEYSDLEWDGEDEGAQTQ
ncbi:MAG: hypothetical protein Q9191_000832 [Dirinaria sp. TL-2023a]